MTRILVSLAAAVAGASLLLTASQAAERRPARDGGPQWPSVTVDEGPQWPNVPGTAGPVPEHLDVTASPRTRRPSLAEGGGPQWPNVPDTEASDRAERTAAAKKALDELDFTGSIDERWPKLQSAERPATFGFDVGTRYWYSSGSIKFAFDNMSLGNPTSTLDWHNMTAHSGEIFARLDHKPSGLFVKGVTGMGKIKGGNFQDMDFLSDQSVFSDTDSRVNGDNFKFATIDFGYSFSPTPGMRIGGFIGYHFWREKVVADGLQCNQQNIFGTCPPGGVVIPYGTPVIEYEATWHALRVGVEGSMRFAERWSVAAELAAVPWAKLQNKDSHLFRDDLGPVPNIFSDSTAGFGLQAELFVNYEITPNIEIGAGVRYWGLMVNRGNVHFGPGFDNSFPLNNFEQHRYGMLLQVKGRF